MPRPGVAVPCASVCSPSSVRSRVHSSSSGHTVSAWTCAEIDECSLSTRATSTSYAAAVQAGDADVDGATQVGTALVGAGVGGDVPHEYVDPAVVVTRGPGVDQGAGAVALDRRGEQLVAEPLRQCHRVPAWLAQVADRQQAEAAVHQPRRSAELLEVVADDPVGQRVDGALCGLVAAQAEGGGVRRVVDRVEVRVPHAPLGPPDLRLLEAVPAQRRAEVDRCVAVGVRGHEVQRGAGLGAEGADVLDPLGRRRRRSAHEQPLVDGLDRGRRLGVEPQVVVLGGGPEDLEVRLVPDLEPPPGDGVDAVALDQVRGEPAVQLAPDRPVLGRRDDALVLEAGGVRRRWRGRPA